MCILVYGAIGQMAEEVLHVGVVVSVGAETDEALLVEVDLDGTHLSYANIYSHVPLAAFDEVRIRQVFLEHALLIVLQVVNVVDDRDSSTLGHVRGFAYPHGILVSFFVVNLEKILVFVGHDEGHWGEIEDFSV